MTLKRVVQYGGLVLLTMSGFAASATASSISYDTSLAAPGYYNGTGNANTNFTVSVSSGIEVGLSAILRYIGPVDPGSGSSTYTVPVGSSVGLALWNYEFSINVNGGIDGSAISDYKYSLQIADTTASTDNGAGFDATLIPDNAEWGGAGAGAKTSGADLSTVYGAQNSENLAYPYVGLTGFDPNAADDYVVTLSVYDSSGSTLLNSVAINVDAVTPEPGTILLTLGGIACLPLLRRRLS